MSYGDVARACGGTDRHARTLNQRFVREEPPGAHRVLKSDGTVGGDRAGRPGRGPPAARGRGPRVRRRPGRPDAGVVRPEAAVAGAPTRPAVDATASPPGDSAARLEATSAPLACRGRDGVGPGRLNGPRMRPPLPPGPFLVVGLARSGRAAAPVLPRAAARRSTRLRRRRRRRRGARRRARGGRRRACTSRTRRRRPARRRRDGRQEPRRAAGGAGGRARRASAACPCSGELELGWRLLPNDGDRDHRVERQDDDDRARRPDPPRGRAARGRGGQRRHGADARSPARSTPPPSSSARRRRSSSRTRSRSRPTPRCCSTSRPTTSTATAASTPTARPSCGSSPTRTPDALAVLPARPRARRPRRAASRSRRRSAAGGRTRPTDVARRPARLARRAASSRVDEIRLRGRAQPARTRWRRRRSRSPAASIPAAVRAALAGFAGVAHRLEEVGARSTASLYVDDSKATNVASAVVGIRSFPGGVHAILGGRGKQEDYAPLAAAVAERCRAAYLIGEEAARLAAALAAAGVPLHDCGDLEHAVAAARAAAAAGRRRAALARLRLVRPVPLVRGARRPLQGARPRLIARVAPGGARADAGRRPGRPVESRSDGRDPGSSRSSTACS